MFRDPLYWQSTCRHASVAAGFLAIRGWVPIVSGTPNLQKLDRANLWDQSYTILKDMILRREFPPNHKLSIPELSENLGVSRTPIRDALQRLEVDGLVRTVSKVGTFVNAINEEFVMNVMDTRLMIECWVADTIPNRSQGVVLQTANRMEEILDDAARRLRSSRYESQALVDDNLQFHLAFVELGQNDYTVGLYRNAMNYRNIAAHASLISREMIQMAHEQHRTIVAALRSSTPSKVKEIVRLHLLDSRERLVANIRHSGGEI